MLMLVNGDGDGDGDGDVKMVNDPGVPNARWREAAMVKVQSRATETKQSFTSGATASWRSFEDKDKEITKTKTTTCGAIKACVSGIPYLNQCVKQGRYLLVYGVVKNSV